MCVCVCVRTGRGDGISAVVVGCCVPFPVARSQTQPPGNEHGEMMAISQT